MAFLDKPIICIGQSSIDVGTSLNRLCKKVEFPSLKLLVVDDSLETHHDGNNPISLGQFLVETSGSTVAQNRTSSHIKRGKTSMLHPTIKLIQRCQLPRCCHNYVEPDEQCSTCGDRIKVLGEQFKLYLDSFESYTAVTVIAEIHTAFSLWVYDQLVGFFDCYKLKSKLQTVLLKPPHKPCGIENAFAVYISALALESSCAVIVRGGDEYLVEFDPEATISVKQVLSLDFADISWIIACDLWPMFIPNNGAFYDQGQYILWPNHFVSTSCKVIDIRSSLHKTFAKLESKSRNANSDMDLKPVRLLSSNVHHLHLSYLAQCKERLLQHPTGFDINLASYTTMVLDTKVKQFRFVHPGSVHDGEFTSLLGWATNGLTWTVLEENNLLSNYVISKSKVISATTTQSSTQIKFATVVLESLYGIQDLFFYCEKTKDILLSGAFNHRLHERAYISLKSISDAITVVESYLDSASPFR